jgi:hypothetical protein
VRLVFETLEGRDPLVAGDRGTFANALAMSADDQFFAAVSEATDELDFDLPALRYALRQAELIAREQFDDQV